MAINVEALFLTVLNKRSCLGIEILTLPAREPKAHPIRHVKPRRVKEGWRSDDYVRPRDGGGPCSCAVSLARPPKLTEVIVKSISQARQFFSQPGHQRAVFEWASRLEGSNGVTTATERIRSVAMQK